MINLTEIEKRIDKVLSNETSSSLTNWLMKNRSKSISEILGNGTFTGLNQNYNSQIIQKSPTFKFDQKSNFADVDDAMLLAA